MTIQTNNPPADTLRYGGLKAVIWSNPGKEDKPSRYSVNYFRTYRDSDGNWKDTTSFGEIDNLKFGHLLPKVADRIAELKAADRSATSS